MPPTRYLVTVLRWLAVRTGCTHLLDDLNDGELEKGDAVSPRSARDWHRRQVLRSLAPLLAEWLRLVARRITTGVADEGRHAVRAALAGPGASATIVIVLALGVGISTAVHGTFWNVLVRPLPYAAPGRLVSLHTHDPARDTTLRGVTGPDFFEHVAGLDAFDQVAAFESFRVAMATGQGAERVEAATMTRTGLAVTGLVPRTGRGFAVDEDGAESARVVMISERLWRAQFADRDVVGESLVLDGTSFRIVGVAPASFALPHERVDLWMPMGQEPARYNRRAPVLEVVARLAATMTLEQARTQYEALGAELSRRYPETHAGRRSVMVPLIDAVAGEQRTPLTILWIASLGVLLVAAANAAALQGGRWAARTGEIATRRALGATRARLLRHFIAESLLLGAFAWLLGLAVATVLLRVIPFLAPSGMPRLDTLALDRQAAIFAFGAALLTALAALVPVFPQVAWSGRLVRAGTSFRATRVESRGLIVLQVAASAILVAAAVAILGVVGQVLERDRGVDSDRLLIAGLDLPASRYPTGMSRYPNWLEVQEFHDRLLADLEVRPGVAGVAVASAPPAGRVGFRSTLSFEGTDGEIQAAIRHVSSSWPRVVGQRLLAGRGFRPDDDEQNARVAIANQTLAARLGGSAAALGQRFDQYGSTWEIVGVATDTDAVGQIGMPAVLLPFRQAPVEFMTIVLRATADPGALADDVRTVVAALDPELALYDVRPLATLLRAETANARVVATLLGGFGVAAIALASVGVLGALMRSVAARRKEIGVRLALGAAPRRLLFGVLREGVGLVLLGLALGAPVVVTAWNRLVSVSPESGSVPGGQLLVAALGFVIVAALASIRPAWRAAATDPTVSMRIES